ncbi:hypothetical protein IGI04_034018, partial [Brassica rapa subsp. trilocularis]
MTIILSSCLMVTHMYVVNIGARKFDQLAKRSVLARGDFGDYESDSRSSISAVSYGSRDGFSGGPGRSSASGQSGKAIIVEGASGRINDTTTKEQERGQIVENEEGETGKGETGEEVKEMEEGQINEWQNVSTEKMGRSPKNDLKYGQVIIATPSRFAVLNDSRDDGEDLDQEENEEDFDDVSQEITAEEKLEDKLSGKKRGRAVLPR